MCETTFWGRRTDTRVEGKHADDSATRMDERERESYKELQGLGCLKDLLAYPRRHLKKKINKYKLKK